MCVKTTSPAEGAQYAVYQVRLPVSKRTLDLVGDLIRRERNRLGTRWRKVPAGTQALRGEPPAQRERAAVEHGFANLKTWRILTKVRMNTHHATTLLRALLVLANTEVQR